MKKIFLLLLILKCSFIVKAENDSTIYPLVVEFHSLCCGVPDNAPLLKYIAAFKKKYKIKKIAYDRIGPLGREGEYDMAFTLKELSKKQAAVFIQQVKLIAPTLKNKGNASVEEKISVEAPGRAAKTKVTL